MGEAGDSVARLDSGDLALLPACWVTLVEPLCFSFVPCLQGRDKGTGLFQGGLVGSTV